MQRIKALRYFVSALAISCACSLVTFAQQASGQAAKPPAAAPPAKVFPADRLAGLVAEWTRARDYTKEYLDAMPEDGLGLKPTPDIRSFAEQMLHLSNANYMFGSIITGAANPMQGKNLEKADDLKASKAALSKTVLDSYDFMINAVKGLDAAKLDEQVNLFNNKLPRSVALAKAFEHQTHHRGQTTIYIRLKGVKPPNERLF